MKTINTIVAVAALAAAACAFGPSAQAQEDVTPKFQLAPNVLMKGQWFEVQIEEGTCPGGSASITSAGFASPVGAGSIHGMAGTTPGTYTATLTCNGTSKTGTTEYQVIDRNIRPQFKIEPSTLEPGQKFEARIEKGDCPDGGTIDSPGFRTEVPVSSPYGVAGDKPGKYTAILTCVGGTRGAAEFEIVPLTPPVTPVVVGAVKAPVVTTPVAKAPVVKPKGAPQTGGGGTA
ncbi:hypothetical protein AB0E59_31140 [Lentzea sp. NPDC034063]|uniref:hypothetical protein n=1 Tax=unclassified Lentzea TaxID=2643253 RepID=UPI0033DE0CF9